MTTPINSDKNTSLPAALSTAGRDGKTPVSHRQGTEAERKHDAPAQAAGTDGQDIDIERANQLLNLTTASPAQHPGGNIENSTQAKAIVNRFQALVNEDPSSALRAQASGLNELHGALLEAQPT